MRGNGRPLQRFIEKLAGGEPPFVLIEHVFVCRLVCRSVAPQGQRPSLPGFCCKQNTLGRGPSGALFTRQDKTDVIIEVRSTLMSIVNENDEANRAISKAKLHALLHVHTPPINVVVFHGPDREYSFSGGFPA